MKLDPEKFALAVVQSSASEFTPAKKLIIYKQAYQAAEKENQKRVNIQRDLKTQKYPNN